MHLVAMKNSLIAQFFKEFFKRKKKAYKVYDCDEPAEETDVIEHTFLSLSLT